MQLYLDVKWKWSWSVCVCDTETERCWEARKQTLSCTTDSEDTPPPTTCLSCLSPSFSIPCTNVGAISHITTCSTVHTDSTPCAKLRGQVSASREKKQRQWQVGKTGVQAVGDNGMSQQRREADHNAETNAVWKASGKHHHHHFLPLNLKSTTKPVINSAAGSRHPAERGND